MLVAVGTANHAPLAVDDEASMDAGSSVLLDVLANDSDPDGDALHIQDVAAPQDGVARIEEGRVRYTAPAGFKGNVAFAYTAVDPAGAADSATMRIQVDDVVQPERPPMPAPSPVPPSPPARTPPPPSPRTPAPPPVPTPPADPGPAPVPNSAPAFNAGADQSVLEDAGPQSIGNWATGISPGPPADGSQTVTFQTTDTNASLFAAGTARCRSRRHAHIHIGCRRERDSHVTVTAIDDGGTANGGVNTSATNIHDHGHPLMTRPPSPAAPIRSRSGRRPANDHRMGERDQTRPAGRSQSSRHVRRHEFEQPTVRSRRPAAGSSERHADVHASRERLGIAQ